MNWQLDDGGAAGTLYSRALVADLCPDALTPLTSTVGVGAGLDKAWRQMYRDAGIDATSPSVARFGSYLYLDTSLLRLLGELTGADPIGFSRQHFAERPDVPRRRDPLEPMPEVDKERLLAWTEATLSSPPVRPVRPVRPERVEHAGLNVPVAARRAQRAGSPLSRCSDAELVARIRGARDPLCQALRGYARAELGASVSNDLLTTLTERAGYPVHSGALVAGLDGSKAHCGPLWGLSTQTSRSATLTRLFDHGITLLADQLESHRCDDLAEFRATLFEVLDHCGHLGPAEWELDSPTWDEDLRLVLGVLDMWRRVADRAAPAARAAEVADTSRAHAAAVRAAIGDSEGVARFDAALYATRRWLCVRQQRRGAVSRVHHEQRLAARELGRRYVASGLLDEVGQIFMLLEEELDAFVADPGSLGEQLRLRGYDYHALAKYQPPFVTVGPPQPVVGWPWRKDAPGSSGSGTPVGSETFTRVALSGMSTGPGTASGPARLPRSPSDTRALRPGEVLVLPTAGYAWLPMLPIVAGVVVDAGGSLSAVSVACRELGIPCLLGTGDATTRIRPGQHLVIKGGAVTGSP